MIELQKLAAIASKELSTKLFALDDARQLPPGVDSLLKTRNGFSAFECALVVFPSSCGSGVPSVFEWNDPTGWRKHYRDAIDDRYCCFAHDVFGVQFAISASEVVRFDPESGEVEFYSDCINGWAKRLLENYEEDTAWPLAHDWQMQNGILSPTMRLLPKTPFILGGPYEASNLVAIDCQVAMEHWGKLYNTIRATPDGNFVSMTGWINSK